MGYPPQREMTDLRASLERCRTQVPGGGSAFAGCFRPPPVHGKRRVVEADGLLSAREVADRVCLAFASPHHEHLSIAENVAGSCTRQLRAHRHQRLGSRPYERGEAQDEPLVRRDALSRPQAVWGLEACQCRVDQAMVRHVGLVLLTFVVLQMMRRSEEESLGSVKEHWQLEVMRDGESPPPLLKACKDFPVVLCAPQLWEKHHLARQHGRQGYGANSCGDDRPPFAVPVTMRGFVRILAPSVPLRAQSCSVPTMLQWSQIPPESSTPTLRVAYSGCSDRGSHRREPALP